MGLFAKGEVVLVPYPFSDLSQSKLRPALVLAAVSDGDYILCQITSRPYSWRVIVEIDEADNRDSGLRMKSYARPEKLFTAHESIVVEKIGRLNSDSINAVAEAVVRIISSQ